MNQPLRCRNCRDSAGEWLWRKAPGPWLLSSAESLGAGQTSRQPACRINKSLYTQAMDYSGKLYCLVSCRLSKCKTTADRQTDRQTDNQQKPLQTHQIKRTPYLVCFKTISFRVVPIFTQGLRGWMWNLPETSGSGSLQRLGPAGLPPQTSRQTSYTGAGNSTWNT